MSFDSSETRGTLHDSSSTFARLVLSKGLTFISPLIKSYHDNDLVVWLIQITVDSSAASEKKFRMRNLFGLQGIELHFVGKPIGFIQALPERCLVGLTNFAALSGLTLLLSITSVLRMRSITSRRTDLVEFQEHSPDVTIATKSKHVKVLLDDKIEQVGRKAYDLPH